jgi:hypothetical protein
VRFSLHQLDAVTEGVSDIHAKVAFEGVFNHVHPGFTKAFDQSPQFVNK